MKLYLLATLDWLVAMWHFLVPMLFVLGGLWFLSAIVRANTENAGKPLENHPNQPKNHPEPPRWHEHFDDPV